jgi:ParB/RepB/Spo0J family partition protein
LRELAQSIKQHGVIQPLVVRRQRQSAHYELIAGERRLRAAGIAGLATVPARIVEATDAAVLEIQLVENVQREPPPFYEEALALRRLQDAPYNYDNKKIAERIGKSEAYVFYQVKLTKMCKAARDACAAGEVSKTVAWFLAKIEDVNVQANVARALRRTEKSKLVSERFARQYLDDLTNGRLGSGNNNLHHAGINGNGTARQPSPKFYSADMSEYRREWRKYLLEFTPEQFAEFVKEVDRKTDVLVWARAVEIVMTRGAAGEK